MEIKIYKRDGKWFADLLDEDGNCVEDIVVETGYMDLQKEIGNNNWLEKLESQT